MRGLRGSKGTEEEQGGFRGSEGRGVEGGL